MKIKRFAIFGFLVSALFVIKLVLNSLLLAENGDTYDFFKISYFIQIENDTYICYLHQLDTHHLILKYFYMYIGYLNDHIVISF